MKISNRFPALDAMRRRWQELPGNVRGAFWILLASLCGATMAALFKIVGQRISVFQIILIRQLIVAAILISTSHSEGFGIFKTPMLRFHVMRGIFASIAMSCSFTAYIYMPLAEAISITFSKTLFVTILAIPFLGERVGIRRWTVTVVGFIGVLIIVRPSPEGVSHFALLALIAAFFMAAIAIVIRKVSQVDRPSTIIAYQSLFIIGVMAGPAIYYWTTPSLTDFVLILVIGAVMWLMQVAMIAGLKAGEAVAVAPVEYSRLLFATIIGIAFFAEVPTVWTVTGAGIIVASTLYTMHRNAAVKKAKGERSK